MKHFWLTSSDPEYRSQLSHSDFTCHCLFHPATPNPSFFTVTLNACLMVASQTTSNLVPVQLCTAWGVAGRRRGRYTQYYSNQPAGIIGALLTWTTKVTAHWGFRDWDNSLVSYTRPVVKVILSAGGFQESLLSEQFSHSTKPHIYTHPHTDRKLYIATSDPSNYTHHAGMKSREESNSVESLMVSSSHLWSRKLLCLSGLGPQTLL